jgi:23S rRNA (guanosine2251-2'-O)-methyltransferase
MREWITGRNPVYEVLRSGRRQVFGLQVAQGAYEGGRLAEIVRACHEHKVNITRVPRDELERFGPTHQGVALEVSGYPYQTVHDVLERAQSAAEPPLILILDTLQDPQNLGTLLRTAEAVGVHGVLLPLRRAATVTPAVVNVSSGASEHLLVAQTNIAQAIGLLKDAGIWVVGLEACPEAKFPGDLPLDGALAFVVGNEAQGIRTLVRKSCDFLLQLPMRGRVASLNAAVAGSIALYLVWGERGAEAMLAGRQSIDV